MNVSFTICLIMFLALAVPLHAQKWVRTAGGTGFEFGYRIAPMPDGGFLTAGTQADLGSTDEDFWITRFDSTGNKVWDKRFGRKGVNETLFGFLATKDHGFMVGGFTGRQFSGEEAATMYRGDSTGALLWEVFVNNDRSDHWHFFVERPGGGYYMGGHTDSKGNDFGDMWLVKMDSARNVIWDTTYGRGGEEHAHMGIGTRDGGCLLLGHAESGQGNAEREKFWAVKVDADGHRMWDSVFSSGDAYHDSPYGLFETRDGNYALVGGSSHATQPNNGTMWLLVIDSVGRTVMNKHYGHVGGDAFSWNARQTTDGGFVLAGYTTYQTAGKEDAYIVKTNAAGEVEWERTVGSTGSDYVYDVVETPSGYVAVGSTDSPSWMTGGGDADLLLIKVSKDASSVEVIPSGNSAGLACTPNPFAHQARIGFTLQRPADVRLSLVDMSGRVVRTIPVGAVDAGERSVAIDGDDIAAGVYTAVLNIAERDAAPRVVSTRVTVVR